VHAGQRRDRCPRIIGRLEQIAAGCADPGCAALPGQPAAQPAQKKAAALAELLRVLELRPHICETGDERSAVHGAVGRLPGRQRDSVPENM
jgi:hypothetical protein